MVNIGAWRGYIPTSPICALANTAVAVPDQISRSALTISTWIVAAMVIFRYLGKRFGFFYRFFNATDHVKRLFWQVIVLAFNNAFKTTDGFFQGHIFAR